MDILSKIKHAAKSAAIAFSMYSKIVMPQFEWKQEDMKYALCFFPFVGAVIAILTWLWWSFCNYFSIGSLCFSFIGISIPLFVTGGIHMDGYIDTIDALHSYANRERKLEILKDAHIGAFALIMTILYVLVCAGAYSQIVKSTAMASVCVSYCISRILSAFAVVSFPCAKKEGTLYMFADAAHERTVKASLYIQLVLCAACQIIINYKTGIIQLCASALMFAYYYYKSKREFAGITGDLAGWFVTLSEGISIVAAAITCL